MISWSSSHIQISLSAISVLGQPRTNLKIGILEGRHIVTNSSNYEDTKSMKVTFPPWYCQTLYYKKFTTELGENSSTDFRVTGK